MTDLSVIILVGCEELHIRRCLEKLAPLEPRQVLERMHLTLTSNGSVEVRVFSDRVEILNPGELPPGKDIAWLMGEHVSIPANPLIAEAFYQTRYIDRAGSGIDDMTDACRSDGLPPPQIKVEYQSFVTVLRRQIHGENPMKIPMKNTGETASKKTDSERLREILSSCTEPTTGNGGER